MNSTIRRLSLMVSAMFLLLIGSLTYVQVIAAPGLNSDARNVRTQYKEYGTNRGPIVIGGQEVAHSVAVDSPYEYQRQYNNGEIFSAITGYYSIVYGSTGLEAAENETLSGTSDRLILDRVKDILANRKTRGAGLELSIDPAAQQAAWDGLAGQRGAAVAIEPDTGRILALVSTPGFDPNLLSEHNRAQVQANYQDLLQANGDPLQNRAIAGDLYAPGSTFKVIVAAAALADGMTPKTVVPAPDTYRLPGSSSNIQNYGGSSCHADGKMPLADAFAISCNTAFAALAVELGADKIEAMAKNFGFGQDVKIPTSVTPSIFPDSLDAAQTGLIGIGQYDLRVTPMQMALVAAGVANEGTVMAPTLVDTVRNADLQVASQTSASKLFDTGLTAAQAADLGSMMRQVVTDGSGTAAQISGIDVAGKTGTAQTGIMVDGVETAPHAWFIGYAPADNPQVAVAVVIENGGDLGSEATGGRLAAPLAGKIMRAVIE